MAKKQDPDTLVRGMDPRIRVHTKMSWIWNTSERDESYGGGGGGVKIPEKNEVGNKK